MATGVASPAPRSRRLLVLWSVALGVLVALGAYGLWSLILYATLPTELPDDFGIEYSTGPCHADRGPRDGITVHRKSRGSGSPEFEVERWVLTPAGRIAPPVKMITSTRPVSPEKLLDLYREICWQRFFRMRDRYWDPRIIDGGGSRLEVTANGKQKSVEVTNTQVRAFDRIIAEVRALP